MIYIGTNFVTADEPCLNLSELNLQSPGSKGFHRYQVIVVVRNDVQKEFRRDLGSSASFKVNQFRIPGGVKDDKTGRIDIVHTVGELMEIADYLREFPTDYSDYARTDLVKRWHEQNEQKRNAIKGKVAFPINGRRRNGNSNT